MRSRNPSVSAVRLFVGTASVVLLGLATSAGAVPIPIGSTLDWTARAIQGVTVLDNDVDSQGATLGTLSVGVLADTGSPHQVLSQATVSASFLNVAAGQVQFDGLVYQDNQTAPENGSADYLVPSLFSYEFVADTDGQLRVSGVGQFTSRLTGIPINSGPFSLQAQLDGSPVFLDGTGGVVTFNIFAGQTHTLRIGMITFTPGLAGRAPDLEMQMSTTIDWDFDALGVPEPGAATLLTAALGGLLWAGRRRST